MVRVVNASWSKQPGCHSDPLFAISLDNVILDELHLMLRVTDRLEEGLIHDVLKWDEVNKIMSKLLVEYNYSITMLKALI